ncbi:nuclease [Fulvimarina pelagi HTCC2506]|uniref:Nuclease n=2 Tax=Fulvimarina pelagi TaxID=217511 RepID=Q0G327_9HYPH|nr:thermonuclease family protein [Fulvimarina pelagi]EAU42004.1 nuclease [Fulvimarina pelagi HTCC2506]BAT30978.1 nuclease [Fulvimarina pelagi]
MGFSPKGCFNLLIAAALAGFPITTASAEEPPRDIAGPVSAHVVNVRDGDTVEVQAFIWPMQSVHVAVRLRGIDAPEKRGTCDAEKEAAAIATDRLQTLLADGRVTLTDIEGDKYFGRVLADLATVDEPDVAQRLLKDGLVVPYGGKTRRDWCTELSGAPVPTPEPRS